MLINDIVQKMKPKRNKPTDARVQAYLIARNTCFFLQNNKVIIKTKTLWSDKSGFHWV